MKSSFKSIALVGVGLIGGSLALRLREERIAAELIGVESDPQNATDAVRLGLVDETVGLDEAIGRADVVILSVPVNSIAQLVPAVLDRVSHQIVLDMGSTKGAAVNSVKSHRARGRYVATHPMWGTEHSGPLAARTDSFKGRVAVLCDESASDADAAGWVRNMYEKIGMRVVSMTASEHDVHVAYVSHVSHLISFALANTVLEKEKEERNIFDLASGGFESTVRLAKSDPSMWVPIFQENSGPILDVLEVYKNKLAELEHSIRQRNSASLGELLHDANRIRGVIP